MRPYLRSFIFMLLSLSTMAARAVVIGDSSRISIYGCNFVGLNIKANRFVAEFLELSIGKRF